VTTVPGSSGIPLDYLIIRRDPAINIQQVVERFHPSMIIIDPSNSWTTVEKWRYMAEKAGVSCYSVPVEGAFVKHFN
jgi:competence protein ComEC